MGGAPEQHRGAQGDAPLSDNPSLDARAGAESTGAEEWFPRPATAADVELVPTDNELDASAIYALLTAPDAVEWREKVGVAGRTDGSGKSSTRLLASGGWVLKTNLALLEESREAATARLTAAIARGSRAGAWHPRRHWTLLRTARGWLPLSACRELRTLRTLASFDERARAWTRMIELALAVMERAGLGLDLNPANFAVEQLGGPLYYVDDEFYPALDARRIAFAIAARVPEEPEVSRGAWQSWGFELREALLGSGVAPVELASILDAVLDYPLAERFGDARAALVAGLRADRPTARAGPRNDLVCVFADVHANAPALLAVLDAARNYGVRRFLFLGDAVGYGPHPRECVEILAELGDALCIRGNHDHAIATGRFELGMNRLARACAEWTRARLGPDELSWLGSLPPEHRDDGWMAVHGAPRDPHRFLAYVYDMTFEDNLKQLVDDGVPLCFHGHTHVPLAHASLPSGPTKLAKARSLELSPKLPFLVNPGSVGQPRDGDPRAAFALWDRSADRIVLERVDYEVARTTRDLARAGLPRELAARLEGGA